MTQRREQQRRFASRTFAGDARQNPAVRRGNRPEHAPGRVDEIVHVAPRPDDGRNTLTNDDVEAARIDARDLRLIHPWNSIDALQRRFGIESRKRPDVRQIERVENVVIGRVVLPPDAHLIDAESGGDHQRVRLAVELAREALSAGREASTIAATPVTTKSAVNVSAGATHRRDGRLDR